MIYETPLVYPKELKRIKLILFTFLHYKINDCIASQTGKRRHQSLRDIPHLVVFLMVINFKILKYIKIIFKILNNVFLMFNKK